MVYTTLLNIQALYLSFWFHIILSVYLYNIGVKRRYITLLNKLRVIVLWTTFIKIRKELEEVSKVHISIFDNLNKAP